MYDVSRQIKSFITCVVLNQYVLAGHTDGIVAGMIKPKTLGKAVREDQKRVKKYSPLTIKVLFFLSVGFVSFRE